MQSGAAHSAEPQAALCHSKDLLSRIPSSVELGAQRLQFCQHLRAVRLSELLFLRPRVMAGRPLDSLLADFGQDSAVNSRSAECHLSDWWGSRSSRRVAIDPEQLARLAQEQERKPVKKVTKVKKAVEVPLTGSTCEFQNTFRR